MVGHLSSWRTKWMTLFSVSVLKRNKFQDFADSRISRVTIFFFLNLTSVVDDENKTVLQ